MKEYLIKFRFWPMGTAKPEVVRSKIVSGKSAKFAWIKCVNNIEMLGGFPVEIGRKTKLKFELIDIHSI